MSEWPEDYWDKARFYYFRDNDGAWGVSDRGTTIQTGMDKNDAAAAACDRAADDGRLIELQHGAIERNAGAG